MKSLALKFFPGIALVAVAALAFSIGSVRAGNERATGPIPSPAPGLYASNPAPADQAVQPGVNAAQPGTPVQIMYVVYPNPIRYAPAYYAAQYGECPTVCTDVLAPIRVNPIPFPDAWIARRVEFAPECRPVVIHGRR